MDFSMWPAWLTWVTVSVVLVVVDMGLLGAQFILIPVAVAALLAAVAAWLNVDAAGQFWTFVVATALAAPVIVHLFRAHLRRRKAGPLEQGWERGQAVTVRAEGARRVARLNGDDFPITLVDGGVPDDGESLVVDHMEGITLKAYRSQSEQAQ